MWLGLWFMVGSLVCETHWVALGERHVCSWRMVKRWARPVWRHLYRCWMNWRNIVSLCYHRSKTHVCTRGGGGYFVKWSVSCVDIWCDSRDVLHVWVIYMVITI